MDASVPGPVNDEQQTLHCPKVHNGNLLNRRNYWHVVLLPARAHSVNLGFVCEIKNAGDGAPPRYEARCVYKNHPLINTSTWEEVLSPIVNKDCGLCICKIVEKLKCFSAPNWASNPVTRQSIRGHVIFFGGLIVSWASKTQKGINALSTTEA